MKVLWSELAIQRVSEIAEYKTQEYPEAAKKWVEAIFDRVMQLHHFPKSGRKVPEINRQNIREIFHKRYRIIYRVEMDNIYILTIRHGREKPLTEETLE